MMAAGERVADEYGIAARRIERAVGLEGELEPGSCAPLFKVIGSSKRTRCEATIPTEFSGDIRNRIEI